MVIRRKFGHGHTQKEEGPVTTEAEKRVLLLQGREHQGLQAVSRGWKRQGRLLV